MVTWRLVSPGGPLRQVLETARQVASYPASSTPMPYDQVKNQCEALVTGKQHKMSALQSFKMQQETQALLSYNENDRKNPLPKMSHPPNLRYRLRPPSLLPQQYNILLQHSALHSVIHTSTMNRHVEQAEEVEADQDMRLPRRHAQYDKIQIQNIQIIKGVG
ncbi:hypothetical protein HAX54_036688 [Datura stramonium]|uniref:Uncharacterized protein n=1 Tax=Datura stramonium TaxID=4076 RepID=A0ABS8VJK7_DATST|nr:hypothetical protein [Datura stramonium]